MDKLMERFKALSIGEKIIIIAAVVLFIDGFLPWYSASAEFAGIKVSASWSGWSGDLAIMSILALLIGLAMGGVVAVKNLATEGTLPDNIGGVTWPKIHLGAGIAALILVIIRFLNHSGDLSFGFKTNLLECNTVFLIKKNNTTIHNFPAKSVNLLLF